MGISLRAVGAQTSATAAVTAVNPATPAGTVVGDAAILTVGVKPYTAVITTPAGWTKIDEHVNGSVAQGADVGSMKVAVYVKTDIGAGVSVGNIGQSGANSMGAVIVVYQKGAGEVWDFSEFTDGSDSTHAANFSATGGANINLAANDWLFAAAAVNTDAGTPSSPTLTATGATLTPVTNRVAASFTTGNDMRLIIGDAPVTAGPSSAAPIVGWTNASSSSGSVIFLRLRVYLGNALADTLGLTDALTLERGKVVADTLGLTDSLNALLLDGKPTIVNVTEFAGLSGTNTISIPEPADTTHGDRVFVLLSIQQMSTMNSSTPGWAVVDHGGVDKRLVSASGEVSGVTWPLVINIASQVNYAYGLFVIADTEGAPLYSASATTSSIGPNTAPDPPNLNAVTAKDYLWLAGYLSGGATVATSGPSGFGPADGVATTGITVGWATKRENVSSMNPSAFGGAANEHWAAVTFAFPPVAVPIEYDKTEDDTLGLTDTLVAGASRPRLASDTLGLSDALGVSASRPRTQDDPLGLTDALTVQQGNARTQDDTLGLTDALSVVSSYVREQADTLGLTDILSAALTMARAQDDTLGLTDALTTQLTTPREIFDTLGLTDELTVEFIEGQVEVDIDDTLGLTDSLTAAATAPRTVDDTLGLTDSLAAAQTKPRAAADPLGLTDALTVETSRPRSQTDTLGLSDALTAEASRPRTQADTLGLSDVLGRAMAVARGVDDTLGLTDSLAVTQSAAREVNDTLGLTDNLIVELIGVGQVTLGEDLHLSDELTHEKSMHRDAADTLGLTDSLTTTSTFGRTAADTLTLADVLSAAMTRARSLADTLGLSDALTTTTSAVRNPADSLTMGDVLTASLSRPREVADTLGLEDELLVTQNAYRVVDDQLQLSDELEVEAQLGRQIDDIFGMTDELTVELIVGVPIADTLGLTDELTVELIPYVPYCFPDTIGVVPLAPVLVAVPNAPVLSVAASGPNATLSAESQNWTLAPRAPNLSLVVEAPNMNLEVVQC